jgi:uncharacterized protein YabN with tetrapyrrole methylase and pyrophosphatase domain
MGSPDRSGDPEIPAALEGLDAITRRLRRECPWDREQDERTIVPHTLEEAYELADAAWRRDDAKLLDELGDVLFQVHFLALLLEERGAGDLAQVARHASEKLIRRHPHVFGEQGARLEAEPSNQAAGLEARPSNQAAGLEARPSNQAAGRDAPRSIPLDSAQVLKNWDSIKQTEAGREPGVFGEVPENLPGPLYARKVQRRAASSGFDFEDVEQPLQSVRDELEELIAAQSDDQRFHELGDVLFAAVNVARKLHVDPELALRAAADRFRGRVQAGVDLAASHGRNWNDLEPDQQLAFYAQARLGQVKDPTP